MSRLSTSPDPLLELQQLPMAAFRPIAFLIVSDRLSRRGRSYRLALLDAEVSVVINRGGWVTNLYTQRSREFCGDYHDVGGDESV